MLLNVFTEAAGAISDKVARADFYHGGNAIEQAQGGISQYISRPECTAIDGAAERGGKPGNGLQAATLAVHAGDGGHE